MYSKRRDTVRVQEGSDNHDLDYVANLRTLSQEVVFEIKDVDEITTGGELRRKFNEGPEMKAIRSPVDTDNEVVEKNQ